MKKTCLFLSVFFLFVSVNLLESTNNVDAIVWLLSVGPGDEDKIVEKRFGQFQNSLKLVIQNYLKPYNKTSSQVSLIVFHSGISSKLSSWKTKTEAIFNTIKFVDVSNHPSFHTPSWRKKRSTRCYVWGLCRKKVARRISFYECISTLWFY